MGIIFSKISPNEVLKDAPDDASSDALGDVSRDSQGDTQGDDPGHAPGEDLGDSPRDNPEDPMEDSQDEQKLISEAGKVKIYLVISEYFEAGYDDNYCHIETGYIDRLDARRAALFMTPDLKIDARNNILGDYGYTQKREILEDSLWIEWKGGSDNSNFKVSTVCQPLYIGTATSWPTHVYVVQVEKQVFTRVKIKKGVLPMNKRVVVSAENKIAGVYVSVTHANQAAKFRFFEIVDPMSRESWTSYREFCPPKGCWFVQASHSESINVLLPES